MKVVKASNALLKQLEEIDFILKKNEKFLGNKSKFARKTILEIKKLHADSEPLELSVLGELFSRLNDILRAFIIKKRDFQNYAVLLDKLSKAMAKAEKNAYYDFFRLCGDCGKCCNFPHVFSSERKFIDKNRKLLKRKGPFFVAKNNPKTRKCCFFDTKTKKCLVYENRPLDCTFFPFSFVIREISGNNIYPKKYIFLIKATECDIADRLSFKDALEALELVCFILSKISLKEAQYYSKEIDPRKMLFDICIPYNERKNYYQILKQISAASFIKKS